MFFLHNVIKQKKKKGFFNGFWDFCFCKPVFSNAGGFRVGFDIGFAVASSGVVLFSIEPKYNIKENMKIGLRIGGAAMVRDIQDN
jgi:hypothetical protein